MNIRKNFLFFLKAAAAGLVAAAILWVFRPGTQDANETRVVEIQQAPVHREAPAPGNLSPAPSSYADAVEPAARAVVNIFTSKVIVRQRHPLLDDPLFQQFFGDRLSTPQKQLQTSLGSGVIVSTQGYILTNNHVITGADEIRVLLNDGRNVQAKVVGIDKETDLAVLHIDLENLPVIPISSARDLRVGDVALAIGNPFGVGQTVTLGIISATGRNRLGINQFEDFIQTDAAINPGNSGGALINTFGELIGINTAIYSRSGGSQGIGFAIPAYLASNVMKQLIQSGHVVRGWLGVEAQDLTPELAAGFGAENQQGMLIAGVLRGGPADTAGLKPGDIIQSINGQPVTDVRETMSFIAEQGPEITLKLTGLRDGKRFSIDVVTVLRPDVVEQDN